MIWLYIYIATVLFCIVSHILMSVEVNLLAKELNFAPTKKRAKGRDFFTWLKIVLKSLVPLWNIILGCAMLMFVFSDKVQKQVIEREIANGELKYKDEG